jgi:outer membrane protein
VEHDDIIPGWRTAFSRRLVPLLVIFLFSGFSSAQAETLQQALARAYETHPSLLGERAKLRSVDETVAEAVSNWRPTATVQADGGVSHRTFDTISANQKPADASVTVAQPLYRGGRTVAATRQAEENVKQERAQLIVTEQKVLADAATAYLDVLQDQAILDLHAANEKTLAGWVAEMNERFRLGERTKTDISVSALHQARARADRRVAESNLRLAHSAYVRFFGAEPDALEKPDINNPVPQTGQEAIDQAVKNAPEVLAADHAERANEENIGLVRGNQLPELSLQGSADKAWNENVPQQDVNVNHSADNQLVLQLKVPLYTGGADSARLRAAYQARSESRSDLNEARREARERAVQAWEQLQAASDNIHARQDQIEAAEAALDGMKKEEQVGDRSSTDTLNAEQDLLDARIAEIQADHDHQVAVIQLMAATGTFTAENLQLNVALYDPEKHYKENRDRWFGSGDAPAE